MESLEIKVSKRTRMVDLPKQFISVEGENLQSKLIFTFIDEFVAGQARLEYELKGEKKYIVLDREDETYTMPVTSILTVEGQIDMQLVISEGLDETNVPIFKSNKFYLTCNASIDAVEEAPEGYDSWMEKANTKLNQVDVIDIDIEDNVVTVVKKDGSTKSENVKGSTGPQGPVGPIGPQGEVGPQGPIGPKGEDYVITEEDYKKIEDNIKEMFVTLTQKDYDKLEVKDENTYYFIIEGE